MTKPFTHEPTFGSGCDLLLPFSLHGYQSLLVLLLLLPLFLISLQLHLAYCARSKVCIVQLAQLVLEVLLVPLLSIVAFQSLCGVSLCLFLNCGRLELARPDLIQWILLGERLSL